MILMERTKAIGNDNVKAIKYSRKVLFLNQKLIFRLGIIVLRVLGLLLTGIWRRILVRKVLI